MSPLFRLTTRTPPEAPPTTATVDAGFIANEVMPPRLKRSSSGISFHTGVVERGSQKIRVPSASAVIILFPVVKGVKT